MGDVGLAIQRAEDKTAQMQARAGAIDELIASGALDDVTADRPRRRHHPRARRDELAVRRRGRAGPAQGQLAAGARARASGRAAPVTMPAGRAPRARRAGGGPAVIVRILGEGQYDVADDALDRLNELDAAVESAVEAGDEAAFARRPGGLLDGVRSVGAAARRPTPRRVRPDPAPATPPRRGPRPARRRGPDPRLTRSIRWRTPASSATPG